MIIKILFVCMGNICRSPMAEAIFSELVKKDELNNQFQIDSVGTIGYHTGEPAHPGTRHILEQHNIHYRGHSRKISPVDFKEAHYLVAMDDENVDDLERLDIEGRHTARYLKLLDFARHTTIRNVPDPYYQDNFAEVYDMVYDGCEGLLAHFKTLHNL